MPDAAKLKLVFPLIYHAMPPFSAILLINHWLYTMLVLNFVCLGNTYVHRNTHTYSHIYVGIHTYVRNIHGTLKWSCMY